MQIYEAGTVLQPAREYCPGSAATATVSLSLSLCLSLSLSLSLYEVGSAGKSDPHTPRAHAHLQSLIGFSSLREFSI